ncbi:MAG: S41 family peptidase [Bacteroidota bacterium]
MNKFLLLCTGMLLATLVSGQENPLWLRYPAISPDGETILFNYKGDIYSVPSSGGDARPLTISESHEFLPVWSHDGEQIAFASDRYGNFDVFVMPSSGGEARRLSFHSGAEYPRTFTIDNKDILFSAVRQDVVTNIQFPTGLMSELYSVPVGGGKVGQVISVPAIDATLNSSGDKLIYHDVKGYESEWRKHHTSAVTRDIWVYDMNEKTYTRLSQYEGEDRNPVFDSNDNDFYYLSEEQGSFNVFRSSLSNPDQTEAVTSFENHPVRFLTISDNNTLCFSYHGEIYTLSREGSPERLRVNIAADGRSTLEKIVPVNGGFTEMKLSPNDKEFAYVFRGEIFVSSVEGGVTRRITNTPWQERSVSFSPDGRSLVYAAEKDSSWDVYTTSLVREEEPYFYVSTLLKEEVVVATGAEEFQPEFSPDGKEVAYLEDRKTLKVINLESKQSRMILPPELNYSYADGDQYFTWSPDGKWFLVHYVPSDRMFVREVGLVSSDGEEEVKNLTLSGYNDVVPIWVMEGKMMLWGSDNKGARAQGGYSVDRDVYGMFFTREAFDRFNLTKEEFALLKEQEKEKEKEETDSDKKSKKDKKGKKDEGESDEEKDDKDKVEEVKIDWDNLTERKQRLTIHTSRAIDWVLSEDGEKLYYLTRFEKSLDIWETELRTKKTKLFAKLGASRAEMELSTDGKFLFLMADGKAKKVTISDAKVKSIAVKGEMVLNQAGERDYIFDHSWRQLREKFYVVDLHGVDWDFYYDEYKKFLPYINNNYDYAEMLSEMLGELNASHTGARFRASKPNSDQTASLGLFYDYTYEGEGLKVAEVILGGPADKAASKIEAGHIIEKIDGVAIDESMDFYKLLNRKTGKLSLLSMYDPASGKRWDETVKPISLGAESQLLYKRWVRIRREETEKLSGGRLGYVHVRSMSDASMRVMVEEALGRHINKEALVVDTRFNGGGNIHEELSDFLTGEKYIDVIPHGQHIGYEPRNKWIKPSIVVMSESNYSDAHLFPVAYKIKGEGKTLGMPVPGTGTFVWWEGQIDPNLVYGIPMGGWRTLDGKFCENNQMEPDIRVPLDPEVMTTGRDQQIEEAVKELLKDLD